MKPLCLQMSKDSGDMDLKEFYRFGKDFGIMPALYHHTELKARTRPYY